MHAQEEELCVNMNVSFSYPCLIVSVKADVIIEISPKFAATIDCLPISGLVTGSLGKNIVTATLQCTVGQSPKGMMVFIYIGHYQGCRVLKCVQGCCRVCPGVLQNVCRDTECVQGAVLTSSLAQQD